MKILNITIKDPENNIIRSIDFDGSGIFYILGNVKEPLNAKGTSNSIGKSLLLKFIDYLYGANEDSKVVRESIHNFILEGCIEHNENKYLVKRILGNSDEIFVNEASYNLGGYKSFFGIKRNIISKQLILNKKAHLISNRNHPNIDDNLCFLKLLNLDEVVDDISNIYSSQDNIKRFKRNKSDLVKFYGDFTEKQIEEEIYYVDKEVERLSVQLKNVESKISNIEISEMRNDIIKEYTQKSNELKKSKRKVERLKFESDRLVEFISNSEKVDITTQHISAIYDKANIEVPEMVIRKLTDVEKFHSVVFEERKEFLGNKKNDIDLEIRDLESNISKLSSIVDDLGKVISINKVYQEALTLYSRYNDELKELKYKQGELSQVKNIEDKINLEDSNLINYFAKANDILTSYKKKIFEYREFVNDITTSIYEDDVYSYFDMKVRKKHQTTRPLYIDLSLKSDNGEGVNEVRKNIIDYLIFKYNNILDFLVQDSSCFNGIDPRQIIGLLKKVESISLDQNKQVIIAINKYQLGDDVDFIEDVQRKAVISLSEKDKLLGFDFD